MATPCQSAYFEAQRWNSAADSPLSGMAVGWNDLLAGTSQHPCYFAEKCVYVRSELHLPRRWHRFRSPDLSVKQPIVDLAARVLKVLHRLVERSAASGVIVCHSREALLVEYWRNMIHDCSNQEKTRVIRVGAVCAIELHHKLDELRNVVGFSGQRFKL